MQSALHSAERRRRFKGRRGIAARGSEESLEKEKGWEPERCGHAEKSARSLGNVQGFPQQLWSPGRPLGQSANVKRASVPRFSMHYLESFQISNARGNARP